MAKTRAQIQADYRARMKSAGFSARHIWVKGGTSTHEVPQSDIDAIKKELETVKTELKKAESRARQVENKMNEGLKAAKIQTVCSIADYLKGKEAAGIAKAILAEYYIDREEAKKYIEELTFKSIDKAGMWWAR
jgi:hypothetical protein